MANIQKRGDNSWCFTVYTGVLANGKYGRRTKTITITDESLLKTKKRLQDHLDMEYSKFREEVQAGEYIAPQKMTIAAFVEEWRTKYAVKQLEHKTLTAYESHLKTRILPTFGHMKLEDVKPLHIVDFLESLSQDGGRGDKKSGGLASGTVQINHRVLKNIFSRAVEWKIIKSNPVAAVQKPKVTSKEIVPYDEQEVKLLLQAIEKEPFHWRMMITLALTTGMRRGELLGLEWKHVDWKTGVIDVSQTLVQALKGEIIVKEPKTKNSKRKVTLPASVLEELRDYYAYRVKERDKLGDAWNGRDREGREWHFMFCHSDGSPFHHERPYLWFRQFIQKNNLRYIRFHDLRHTSATLLINQGVHAKIISERLGHGNISTTMNIYGHALQSADQAAADKLDSLFSKKGKSAKIKTLQE
ncbi:integrase [Paenibacillus sp. IHB B 3415]|uniref:site-specific integrase n=1 Tax=Paenibacillus sp. IHB B 3415 TaxID=867080 RepID=UPI0005736792|nr:tyrosine-type recombinase/integrase [Paenibacillus sp. IHB B 3415]KHL95360.1 integrase [Paenibacillus sp. IHB B 3415]